MLDIVDIKMVSDLAHKVGATVIVDNVMASPVYQKPLQLGADVVMYSATKHIDGQGRVLAGAVLGSFAYMQEHFLPFFRHTGPNISAFNAWVLLKSLETMQMRVEKMNASAQAIAEFLESRKEVKSVRYPGLKSHANYALAQKQMSGAGGTNIGIELNGLVSSTNFGKTKYLDPITTANSVARELKQKDCDLIICLSHLGYDYPDSTRISDRKLAQNTSNIDIILGGHTHTFFIKLNDISDKFI
jgi:cystathionine beta-lyase/cystathionine gamma-synthase